MASNGFPVYGANGVIGRASTFTHNDPVIAVGCRGTIGAVHVTEPRSFVTGNAMALDNLATEIIDRDYLVRYLRWRGLADVTSGSSQPQLTRQGIVGVEVPVPPMEGQRRIAAILDQADALRAKRREVLAHLDSLPQALFQHMFGKTRWPMTRISEVGRVTTGKTPPTAAAGMFGGPIPFVTPGDLGLARPATRTLSEDGALASRTVRAGSALVCCIGATIGKLDIARAPSAFNQQINAVDWGERIVDEYGLEALRSQRSTIIARGASTTMPLLTKTEFSKVEIPVPPVDLQQAFAHAVSGLISHRRAHARQLIQADALFQSLQSRAFRGEL